MKPIRFGLIGCGAIGELRAQAIIESGLHQLIAVNDLDESRSQAMADKHACVSDRDWHSLIQRKDVDVVIVSTPPSSHAEMSIEALRRGKHVLCEKPLACTTEECQAMNEEARQNDRILATGFNYRFYPSILKARELLDAGLIGKLNHIRSYAGYSANDHHQEWLHDVKTMGGGALRDNGVHLLDLTLYFLGEVDECQGLASNAVWQFPGCEDNGFLLLRGKNGVIATLQASWTEWRGYRFLIELYGTLGCIRAWCFPIMVEAYWSQHIGGRTQRKRFFFPKTFLFEHLRTYRWVVVQSFIQEFKALSQSLQGETSPLASGVDGLRTVELASSVSSNLTE